MLVRDTRDQNFCVSDNVEDEVWKTFQIDSSRVFSCFSPAIRCLLLEIDCIFKFCEKLISESLKLIIVELNGIFKFMMRWRKDIHD